MFGNISRGLLAVPLIIGLSGCDVTNPGPPVNPYGPSRGFQSVAPPRSAADNAAQNAAAANSPVVQAYCPQIVLPEQTAVYQSYARGGDNSADKLLYQASFGDMTRQCTANETTLTINVLAQLRLVQGPAGTPGRVSVPILVEVVDGDKTIYSQKVSFPVDMSAGSTQLIFNKPDVQIPNAAGGASRFTRVRLGFDTGAASAKKPARRG